MKNIIDNFDLREKETIHRFLNLSEVKNNIDNDFFNNINNELIEHFKIINNKTVYLIVNNLNVKILHLQLSAKGWKIVDTVAGTEIDYMHKLGEEIEIREYFKGKRINKEKQNEKNSNKTKFNTMKTG